MHEAQLSGASLAMTEKDRVKLPTDQFPTLLVLKRKIQNHDWLNFVFERLQ
jgi:hypothetical protein